MDGKCYSDYEKKNESEEADFDTVDAEKKKNKKKKKKNEKKKKKKERIYTARVSSNDSAV